MGKKQKSPPLNFDEFVNSLASIPLPQQYEIVEDQFQATYKDVTQIKSQLDEARAHRIKCGEFADPDWFRKAEHARRVKAHQLMRLQTLRSDIRKKLQRDEHAKSQDAIYITNLEQAIRENVDPGVADRIFRLARELTLVERKPPF